MNNLYSVKKVLIVATNYTTADLDERVKTGLHQRVDYFDLEERTGGEYIDYGIVQKNPILEKLEDFSKLDLRLAARAAQLVKEKAYTSVISMSERVGIPLALLLPRSVKHLVIQHHPLSSKKIMIEKLLRLHKRWDQIITISQAEKDELLNRLDIDPHHITAIYCPVDTDFFSPLPDSEAPGQEGHIESLGLSYRDYRTLIRALQAQPEIRCYFRVGSSWVTRNWGFEPDQLPANIEIQPYVSPDVLKEKISQSRFIIVPIQNFSQWSAGCTTVQIAQAMGKAVVATDLPGLRGYMIHGETGLLVKPENPQAMAEAIDFLWNNPDIARKMGEKGREFQKNNFSIDLWLNKIIELL
jgi:glycosyltransferase involved in cell wall biosynthesis